ncbi:hypothetical protein [Lactococcus lactis]|uniref:hypothetical protein n=2 Tax=Lactococcus lactis TaxID=1358 RepID=UPI0022E322CC|nr:hypothetical protein [Lactococcus lactis]
MRKSKIFALVGSIIFSILALVGLISFWAIIYMPENSEIMTELQDSGFDKQLLSTAAMIAALILIALLALNWVAFARLTKEKGWGIYFLVVGIFYCVASVFNGVGLILTLPVALCFILAYVYRRREVLEINKKNY